MAMPRDGRPVSRPTATPAGPAGDSTGHIMQMLGRDHLDQDVIRKMATLGNGVVPTLGTIASGERTVDAYRRENAIYVLGMMGQADALRYLVPVLWSPDLNLQLLAARALGRIGTPAAIAELRRLYNGYPAPSPGTPAPSPAPAASAQFAPSPMPPALALELREILGAARDREES